MYSGKPRHFLKVILSINCFSSSKLERPSNCCKENNLNIKITLASGLPLKTVLLEKMESKMMLKNFQPIKVSFLASLSPTD